MKTIQVFSFVVDSLLDSYNQAFLEQVINKWVESEEYKFLEKNCIKIEQIRAPDHDRFETHYLFHATMDEQIETFWRLKFK